MDAIPRRLKKAVRDQEFHTFSFTVESLVGCPHLPGKEYYIDWDRGTHEGSTSSSVSTASGVIEFNDTFRFVTGLYLRPDGGHMTKKLRLKICQRDVTSSRHKPLHPSGKRRDREEMRAQKVGVCFVDLGLLRKQYSVPVDCNGPKVILRARLSHTPCGSESHASGCIVLKRSESTKSRASDGSRRTATPLSVTRSPQAGSDLRPASRRTSLLSHSVTSSSMDGGGARRATDRSETMSDTSSFDGWDTPKAPPRRRSAAHTRDDGPPADEEDLAVLRGQVGDLLSHSKTLPKRSISRDLHLDMEELRGVYKPDVSHRRYRQLEALMWEVEDKLREAEMDTYAAEEMRSEHLRRASAASVQQHSIEKTPKSVLKKRLDAESVDECTRSSLYASSHYSDSDDGYARYGRRDSQRMAYSKRQRRRSNASARTEQPFCQFDGCTVL
eukprot:TRINITY_DN15037_c0_g3_i1.p1 TRINITY_DN15037_c0_g3~~TRINITY_DN15037_c0_g3_i1.p1  ORF type:complete len:442 (+),score=94.39 TRINITY_DN15037_c0_g3_i1:610-1935(+)